MCSKKQRGAPTAAGSAGIEWAAVGGGGVFMTIGGIEPPLLWYESIPLTSGPVQASYPVLRVCSTNMHMRIHTALYHISSLKRLRQGKSEHQHPVTPCSSSCPGAYQLLYCPLSQYA